MSISVDSVGNRCQHTHTKEHQMIHPEQAVTELLTLLKQRPSGVTMNVETLGVQEGNYYAIGGFVQAFDGFNALAYRIVDDLPALLDSEEFFGDLERRFSRNWDAIKEHGCIGAWYEHGELFIDVVEAWDCRCNEADQGIDKLGTTVVRLAIRKGHELGQDAIGHVCDRVGGYETIPVEVY